MRRLATISRSIAALALAFALAPGCGDASSPPLLWEATSTGGSTGYLLGTIHLGVSARDHLPPVVWDRYTSSRTVVAEAEVRSINQQLYMVHAGLPGGKTLDQLVPPATWSALVKLLPVSQLTLKKLRPWAVTSLIYAVITPDTEAMDLTFLNAADADARKLLFLERWEDQAAALNAIPEAQAVQGLVWLMNNLSTIKKKTLELIDAYRLGDIAVVERVAPEAGAVPAVSDPFHDTFIVKRNAAWLPTIEKQIDAGGAFIAVGFGHLLGSKGLVQNLKSRGYQVRRVE